MQIEDIWLCWRLALLRVASSTSDRFESNVIKLFFFEIPLYVNRAAGSVHFLCKSEYLYRTFAHYSLRAFRELQYIIEAQISDAESMELLGCPISELCFGVELTTPEHIASLHDQQLIAPREFVDSFPVDATPNELAGLGVPLYPISACIASDEGALVIPTAVSPVRTLKLAPRGTEQQASANTRNTTPAAYSQGNDVAHTGNGTTKAYNAAAAAAAASASASNSAPVFAPAFEDEKSLLPFDHAVLDAIKDAKSDAEQSTIFNALRTAYTVKDEYPASDLDKSNNFFKEHPELEAASLSMLSVEYIKQEANYSISRNAYPIDESIASIRAALNAKPQSEEQLAPNRLHSSAFDFDRHPESMAAATTAATSTPAATAYSQTQAASGFAAQSSVDSVTSVDSVNVEIKPHPKAIDVASVVANAQRMWSTPVNEPPIKPESEALEQLREQERRIAELNKPKAHTIAAHELILGRALGDGRYVAKIQTYDEDGTCSHVKGIFDLSNIQSHSNIAEGYSVEDKKLNADLTMEIACARNQVQFNLQTDEKAMQDAIAGLDIDHDSEVKDLVDQQHIFKSVPTYTQLPLSNADGTQLLLLPDEDDFELEQDLEQDQAQAQAQTAHAKSNSKAKGKKVKATAKGNGKLTVSQANVAAAAAAEAACGNVHLNAHGRPSSLSHLHGVYGSNESLEELRRRYVKDPEGLAAIIAKGEYESKVYGDGTEQIHGIASAFNSPDGKVHKERIPYAAWFAERSKELPAQGGARMAARELGTASIAESKRDFVQKGVLAGLASAFDDDEAEDRTIGENIGLRSSITFRDDNPLLPWTDLQDLNDNSEIFKEPHENDPCIHIDEPQMTLAKAAAICEENAAGLFAVTNAMTKERLEDLTVTRDKIHNALTPEAKALAQDHYNELLRDQNVSEARFSTLHSLTYFESDKEEARDAQVQNLMQTQTQDQGHVANGTLAPAEAVGVAATLKTNNPFVAAASNGADTIGITANIAAIVAEDPSTDAIVTAPADLSFDESSRADVFAETGELSVQGAVGVDADIKTTAKVQVHAEADELSPINSPSADAAIASASSANSETNANSTISDADAAQLKAFEDMLRSNINTARANAKAQADLADRDPLAAAMRQSEIYRQQREAQRQAELDAEAAKREQRAREYAVTHREMLAPTSEKSMEDRLAQAMNSVEAYQRENAWHEAEDAYAQSYEHIMQMQQMQQMQQAQPYQAQPAMPAMPTLQPQFQPQMPMPQQQQQQPQQQPLFDPAAQFAGPITNAAEAAAAINASRAPSRAPTDAQHHAPSFEHGFEHGSAGFGCGYESYESYESAPILDSAVIVDENLGGVDSGSPELLQQKKPALSSKPRHSEYVEEVWAAHSGTYEHRAASQSAVAPVPNLLQNMNGSYVVDADTYAEQIAITPLRPGEVSAALEEVTAKAQERLHRDRMQAKELAYKQRQHAMASGQGDSMFDVQYQQQMQQQQQQMQMQQQMQQQAAMQPNGIDMPTHIVGLPADHPAMHAGRPLIEEPTRESLRLGNDGPDGSGVINANNATPSMFLNPIPLPNGMEAERGPLDPLYDEQQRRLREAKAATPSVVYGGRNFVQMEEPEHIELKCKTQPIMTHKTFGNFAYSGANTQVVTAAMIMAENPGLPQHNPFYIFGQSGVGKTHLLHATINLMKETHPNIKVAYIRAPDFVQYYVATVTEGLKTHFTAQQIYFQKAFTQYDVLVFEDVHLLKGVKSCNAFYEIVSDFLEQKGKQLIVSANASPAALTQSCNLDPSLTSRLGSGVCFELYGASLNARTRLVLEKSAELGFNMTHEIAQFIATNASSDLRELDGAIKTLNSGVNASQGLSYHDAINKLGSFMTVKKKVLSVDEIQSQVATEFNVTVEEMKSPRKKRHISVARSVAMTLIRDLLPNLSLKDIGQAFKKDHTSVHEAIVRTRDRINADLELKSKCHRVVQALSKAQA